MPARYRTTGYSFDYDTGKMTFIPKPTTPEDELAGYTPVQEGQYKPVTMEQGYLLELPPQTEAAKRAARGTYFGSRAGDFILTPNQETANLAMPPQPVGSVPTRKLPEDDFEENMKLAELCANVSFDNDMTMAQMYRGNPEQYALYSTLAAKKRLKAQNDIDMHKSEFEMTAKKIRQAPLSETESDMAMTKLMEKFNKIPVPMPSMDSGANMITPASPSERTAMAEAQASLDSLNNLKDLVKPAYVGPLAGRIGKIGDVFGTNSSQHSQFNAATAAFKNAVIKQITGAQMGEREADRIIKQIPDVTDPPTVWQAKWQESMKNIQYLQQERARVLSGSNIRTPSMGRQSSNPPTINQSNPTEEEIQAIMSGQ